MVRSEALKLAQKKYLNKIKEEKTEVYQNIIKKQKEYQKNYNKNKELTQNDKDKFNEYAKKHYMKNREIILLKRKEKRMNAREKEIKELLSDKLSEIIIL
tara:strand:+ start:61 stop:360 length:300 start_codon:yes stop_codon:yes gene_type:complete